MKRNQTSSQCETHPRVGSEKLDGPQGNSCVQVKTIDSPFQSHLPEPPRFSNAAAAAAAKSLQSCPTLCDPKDGSPPGSPIPGILQARVKKKKKERGKKKKPNKQEQTKSHKLYIKKKNTETQNRNKVTDREN